MNAARPPLPQAVQERARAAVEWLASLSDDEVGAHAREAAAMPALFTSVRVRSRLRTFGMIELPAHLMGKELLLRELGPFWCERFLHYHEPACRALTHMLAHDGATPAWFYEMTTADQAGVADALALMAVLPVEFEK